MESLATFKVKEELHSFNRNKYRFIYKCSECPFSAATKDVLELHTTSHTAARAFACDECDFTCPFENELDEHILNDCKKYSCAKCDFKSNDMLALQTHSDEHFNKVFKCMDCDYKTHSPMAFRKHQQTCGGIIPDLFTCNLCNFNTTSRTSFNRHKEKHTSRRNRLYVCKFCDYHTNKRNSLTSHELTHTKNKRYKCDQCDYSAIRSDYLQKHIASHQKHHRPFKCHLCDYSAVRSDYLKKHLSKHPELKFDTTKAIISIQKESTEQDIPDVIGTTVISQHGNLSEFKCSACDFYTTDVNEIHQHFESHAGVDTASKNCPEEILLKCPQCRFTTRDSTRLVAHQKSHKRADMTCFQCSFVCSTSSEMRSHISTTHEKEYIEIFPSEFESNAEIIMFCDPNSIKKEDVTIENDIVTDGMIFQ